MEKVVFRKEREIEVHDVDFKKHYVISAQGEVLVEHHGKYYWVSLENSSMRGEYNDVEEAVMGMMSLGQNVYVTNEFIEILNFLLCNISDIDVG